MVVNIEDAGFEIRDVVSWIYGSGFPKSLNISKAIDKAAGAEREVVGVKTFADGTKQRATARAGIYSEQKGQAMETAPATEAAKQWDGWGTALKPSSEFFTLCRKPLSEKTIAANVLKWGTGGINIDGCRVEGKPRKTGTKPTSAEATGSGNTVQGSSKNRQAEYDSQPVQGRFPANLIHDGSQEVLDLFPETKTNSVGKALKAGSINKVNKKGNAFGVYDKHVFSEDRASQGSAARFFYCAKASKKDRDEGNTHPTVKPTALMQYLCRLITPAGGTVLDPYMGSGSTGKAAMKEGFSFVGCELDTEYYEIASARINAQAEEVSND
jgi:site-specific DNA-methyltransferase (adenine-specific)